MRLQISGVIIFFISLVFLVFLGLEDFAEAFLGLGDLRAQGTELFLMGETARVISIAGVLLSLLRGVLRLECLESALEPLDFELGGTPARDTTPPLGLTRPGLAR